MPFAYDKQQLAFVDAVANVVRDQEQASGDTRNESRDLWAKLVGLDVPAIPIPEAYDGLGMSPVEMVAVVEAAGRSRIATPMAMTLGVFTPTIAAAAGHSEAAAKLLGRLLGGATGTFAPTETCPDAGEGASRAVLKGTRLTVSHTVVPDAGADLVAVPATRSETDEHVLVVATPKHLGLSVHAGIGRALPVGVLDITDRELDRALVFQYNAGQMLPLAWTAAAAELTGLASALVERSVDYAKEREQFGQAIGHFQGIKHRLVDAHLGVERARSLTMYAALAMTESRDGIIRAAHHAKAAASDAASEAARAAVQVHGATGITAANPISSMYLRAREKSMLLGGPDDHYGCACLLAEA